GEVVRIVGDKRLEIHLVVELVGAEVARRPAGQIGGDRLRLVVLARRCTTRKAVVADEVTGVKYPTRAFGELLDPPAEEKERGLNVGLGENRDRLLGARRIRAIVERERDAITPANAMSKVLWARHYSLVTG